MKKVLTIVIIYLIGLGCVLALCERSENLDQKKELPVTTQSNSFEK